MRFDYGALVPWVRHHDGGVEARGGADGVVLHSSVATHGRDLTTFAGFDVTEGSEESFALAWFPSHEVPPEAPDVIAALEGTTRWWRDWIGPCTAAGPWRDAVVRSLLTLKALSYEPTGGIAAAATTSLPEWIGSVRNWDYRYCWLRDATFTLNALLENGFHDEAMVWSEWLRRAVAGSPDKLQIMYGVAGERRLDEYEIPWLAGYEGSAPVRVGNGASGQFQLDVYGEVLDMMFHSAEALEDPLPHDSWALCRMLVEHVGKVWQLPDDGIWEVRGPQRHFVHSKVMAWVAVDRWVKLCEAERPEEPLARWRRLRDEIHAEVCDKGWNAEVGSFTQYYGCDELDASLLMLALVGFLPPDDERIVATVEAIERELLVDGFVLRYRTEARHRRDPVADAGPRRGRGRRRHHDRRRAAAGRGLVPAHHVLAGRQPRADRPGRRGEGGLRAAAGAAQRRRTAVGGVRPGGRAHARQLPAGVLPHRADQLRGQPRAGPRGPGGPAQPATGPARGPGRGWVGGLSPGTDGTLTGL